MGASESRVIGGYELGKELGSGQFGKVYSATKDKGTYAVKKIDDVAGCNDMIMKEVNSQIGLSHENVVKYYGNFYKDNAIWIILEYCNGGNLNSYFLNNSPTYSTLLDFFQQVCRGVDYLHSQNVIHRDIKPDNIMICTRFWGLGWEYTLKLADFGLARVWENFNYQSPYYTFSYDPRGPPFYSAPEIANGNITVKSDIFSLGCLVLAMFTRTKIPWINDKQLVAPYIHVGFGKLQIADATEEQKWIYIQQFVKLPVWDAEKSLQRLVFSMVQKNWQDRPTARMALTNVDSIGAVCTIL